MRIDEQAFVPMPVSARRYSRIKKNFWVRHAIIRALWEMRNKFIVEDGVDIFNVVLKDDGVTVTLRGIIDVSEVPEEKVNSIKSMFGRRKGK